MQENPCVCLLGLLLAIMGHADVEKRGLEVFKCADCESCIGFLARVAEHWLGTHANMRVFQCPRCPYNSAWARCVRMHYTRAHEPHGDLPETLMWKSSPILVQVDTLLTNLKADVEASVKVSTTSETTNESHQPALQKPVPATRGKRSSKSRSRQHRDGGDDGAASRGLAGAVRKYACGYCSYSTDRRDLFTRHENIHKEEKPFVCFVCAKQFNRADHVKKHFLRIHPDVPYDIKMIRRKPGSTCEDPQVAAAMRNVPTGRKSFQLLMAGNKLGKTKEMESTMKKEDFLFPGPEITISRHMAPIVAPVLHLAAVPTRPPVPDLIYMPKFTPTALAINHFPLFPVAHGKPRPAKKAKLKPDPVPKTSPKKKPTAALLDDDATRIRPSTTTTTTNGSDEKRFTCSFCPWTGVDSWCLKRHLNTHVKPYTCPMCDYKAARMERLQLHVGRVHCKKICSKCSQLFDMQDDLMKHVEEEHVKLGQRPPKTVCLECGTVLDSRSSLETHMIIVHRGSLLKCSLCDFCTADPATMDAHCSQRHSKPVVDLADIDGKKAELWSGQGLLFYQQALATLPASIGSDSGKEVSSDEKPSRKRKHSGERTTEVYKCDQCSEEYSRRIGLLLKLYMITCCVRGHLEHQKCFLYCGLKGLPTFAVRPLSREYDINVVLGHL
ncbi:unnamed protein product [Notodromas monacha]|uniref:C2H2-type domain-containing protein n=1 Tax=Notodromas monacha TaxID=399045 RepID=A0A7R9BU54_9CRUS|nr:unnamed protein product [Notodromas monacha]CAG0920409.1 unnamed protein product [Notodromas monacha]